MALQELLTSGEFWKIVLTSSLITSVVSAITNWYFSMKKFEKESMAGFIGARASLYSRLWFWLNIWCCTDIDRSLTWGEFTVIDEILTEKQHLLSPEIQTKWFSLHDHVRDENEVEAANTVQDLISIIRNEYNTDIRNKYIKYVGTSLQLLSEREFT